MKALSIGGLNETSTRCVDLCRVWDELGGILYWANKWTTMGTVRMNHRVRCGVCLSLVIRRLEVVLIAFRSGVLLISDSVRCSIGARSRLLSLLLLAEAENSRLDWRKARLLRVFCSTKQLSVAGGIEQIE